MRASYLQRYLRWAFYREPEGAFIIEQNGECVGFVIVRTYRWRCRAEVVEVAIGARWQGCGFGLRLMAHAESHARARGCRSLLLEVRVENRRAR